MRARLLLLVLAACVPVATACATGSGAATSAPAVQAMTSAAPASGTTAPGRAAQKGSSAAIVWAVGDAFPDDAGRELAARVRREHPDLFLYLGDVYETGTAEEFRTHYDPLYGPLARRSLPTPGNHEWPNRDAGYRPYWTAKTGQAVPDWRRRRIAGWDILSLNSEADHDALSPQVAWLTRAVRRPGTCRIAIWHRPRYSSGYHGSIVGMDPLWQAFAGHGRLVISGHDHDLQRLADRDGLRQLVSGAGGRSNVPIPRRSRDTPAVRFADRLRTGGMRLHLRRGRATVDIVAADGRLLDRSRVRCRPLSA